MRAGGFDVIVGNPPYVEYSKVRNQYSLLRYATLPCGNLFAQFIERSYQLLSAKDGRVGLIVPLSLVCTKRTSEVREILLGRDTWISCFDMRPSSLFVGVAQRLCILLSRESPERPVMLRTGGYRRWSASERDTLLASARYIRVPETTLRDGLVPKLQSGLEVSILGKISGPSLQMFTRRTGGTLYVHRIVRYFVKALDFVPMFITSMGSRGRSEDYKEFRFDRSEKTLIAALLNSSLFYWFWRSYSDGFHCGYSDVYLMPYRQPASQVVREGLVRLYEVLMKSLQSTSTERSISTRSGTIRYQEFSPKDSKPIIDDIDCTLAKHYGLSDEELDFIINYDIKYRLGQGKAEGDDE